MTLMQDNPPSTSYKLWMVGVGMIVGFALNFLLGAVAVRTEFINVFRLVYFGNFTIRQVEDDCYLGRVVADKGFTPVAKWDRCDLQKYAVLGDDGMPQKPKAAEAPTPAPAAAAPAPAPVAPTPTK